MWITLAGQQSGVDHHTHATWLSSIIEAATSRTFDHSMILRHAATVGYRRIGAPRRALSPVWPPLSQSVTRHNHHVVHSHRPFRLAIIGSGPAGFYGAYKAMSRIEYAVVDMYEKLPVPYGLVRFGVAPDHPEVKVCDPVAFHEG